MSPSSWLAPRALAQLATRQATRQATRDQPPQQAIVIPFHDAERAGTSPSCNSGENRGLTLPDDGKHDRPETPK